MMKVIRKQKIELSDLKHNMFVRKELDHEHAAYLAELIKHGTEMSDRIKVTEDLTLVDGRHREEAFQLNNILQVEVDIVDITNEVELIAEAYKANTGGSKPPTPGDTEYTVMQLLERRESIKNIASLLGLPPGLTRKFVTDVRSRMNRAKLERAVTAVVEDSLSVDKAAEQYDVDVKRLKEQIAGRKPPKSGVGEIQKALSTSYRSISSKNARIMRKLLDEFEDGEVTAKQVTKIVLHIERLQKRSTRAIVEWKRRFTVLTNAKGKAGAAKNS